jgi:hypothetical protein
MITLLPSDPPWRRGARVCDAPRGRAGKATKLPSSVTSGSVRAVVRPTSLAQIQAELARFLTRRRYPEAHVHCPGLGRLALSPTGVVHAPVAGSEERQ